MIEYTCNQLWTAMLDYSTDKGCPPNKTELYDYLKIPRYKYKIPLIGYIPITVSDDVAKAIEEHERKAG